MHPYRQRAKVIDTGAFVGQPYVYQEYGTDPLLYWYAQVRGLGEHLYLWGHEAGLSPSRFVAAAVGWEILFVRMPESSIAEDAGVIGVVWGDDAHPPRRQRVHFWIAPPYRHPMVTQQLAQIGLAPFFERYAVLWGITPATYVQAIRAIRRWGFQEVGRLPASEWIETRAVDGVISVMTREQFLDLQAAR